MTWIKVDDHYDEHPKLVAVGPLGQALWLAGLAYCNRNLTDGFIPWGVARSLISWEWLDEVGVARIYVGTDDSVHEEGAVTSDYVIALLVNAGVWEQDGTGYRIHDYADFQPTKAQVMAERAAKQAAGRAGGRASAQARAQADAKQVLEQNASNRSSKIQAKSNPVPVPVPVPGDSEESPSSREGIFDAYHGLTGRAPSPGATSWLGRLADEYADDDVIKALGAEWQRDPDPSSFLGRVQTRLLDDRRRRTKEADEARRRADKEHERRERERIENATPEEKARADEIKRGIETFLKGDAA